MVNTSISQLHSPKVIDEKLGQSGNKAKLLKLEQLTRNHNIPKRDHLSMAGLLCMSIHKYIHTL